MWDGGQPPSKLEIPGDVKMWCTGEVKVDFREYGLEITGKIEYQGLVRPELRGFRIAV